MFYLYNPSNLQIPFNSQAITYNKIPAPSIKINKIIDLRFNREPFTNIHLMIRDCLERLKYK